MMPFCAAGRQKREPDLGLDSLRRWGYASSVIEALEHLIEQASDFPKHPRSQLFKELLQSETFLLNLGKPLRSAEPARMSWSNEAFDIWADKDPEMGGIWVPVFAARDAVAQYVEAKGLRAPEGKEFLWMENRPGQVFSILRGISCFSGLSLHLDADRAVALPWPEVKALAEGRIPSADFSIYPLPIDRLCVPAGVKTVSGRLKARGTQGRVLCVPQAGHFRADDLRKLVKIEDEQAEPVWMPCRHFLQVLRHLRPFRTDGAVRYFEDLLDSMIAFEMYGDGEALCEWLAEKGQEALAWVYLAKIFARTGRLEECVNLCRRAKRRYPEERAFFIGEGRALLGLSRAEEAGKVLDEALLHFPNDVALLQLGARGSYARRTHQ